MLSANIAISEYSQFTYKINNNILHLNFIVSPTNNLNRNTTASNHAEGKITTLVHRFLSLRLNIVYAILSPGTKLHNWHFCILILSQGLNKFYLSRKC
jgi:hypothetical protein